MGSASYTSFSVQAVPNSEHAVRLTIDNPPINLINPTLLTELHDYLTSLETSPATAPKVIVVSSADTAVWCSHLDLRIISARHPLQSEDGDPGHLLHLLGDIVMVFQTLPTIFIAEVNGLAVGGGNEFAENMDMRFAGPDARFGAPEVAGGVVHGGAVQQLTKLVGAGRAMEMILSARAVTAHEAERVGLVNKAFDDETQLRDYVDSLAARIASFPRGGIEAAKKGVVECLQGKGSMQQDLQRLGQLAHTEEAQERIRSFIEGGDDQRRTAFELNLPNSIL
ncbi:hypothetical protein LTR85_010977 [Meristemomyces frigidus]|nr:hypothetical protein LTR85_010977 [Meristemomyces frigidus]